MSGDFDFEPIRGLPAVPPDGEKILWQGAPDWQSMARHTFHVRKISIYFAILLAWYAISSAYDGVPLAEASYGLSIFAMIAFVCLALLLVLAWGYARSSVFTVTSKRLVLRHGIALPITVNIPFSKIDSADMQLHADGTGTIAFAMRPGNRIAWLALWPNVRPWRVAKPMPALRCIQKPQDIARLVGQAIAAAEGETIRQNPVIVPPERDGMASASPPLGQSAA